MTEVLSGALGKHHNFTVILIKLNTVQLQALSWRFSIFTSISQRAVTAELVCGSTVKNESNASLAVPALLMRSSDETNAPAAHGESSYTRFKMPTQQGAWNLPRLSPAFRSHTCRVTEAFLEASALALVSLTMRVVTTVRF